MLPIHLGSLRSRVASAQTEVPIPSETHRSPCVSIFTNSESYLTENRYRKINVQAYIFCYRVPEK